MKTRLRRYDQGYVDALTKVAESIRKDFPVNEATNLLYNYGGGLDDALAMIDGYRREHLRSLGWEYSEMP